MGRRVEGPMAAYDLALSKRYNDNGRNIDLARTKASTETWFRCRLGMNSKNIVAKWC